MDLFASRVDSTINFDLRKSTPEKVINESFTLFPGGSPDAANGGNNGKFREQFFSAVWTGLITPPHAELFTFSLLWDGQSDVRLRIGGSGTATNGSVEGQLVVSVTASGEGEGEGESVGTYQFTDRGFREFELEYVHYRVRTSDIVDIVVLYTSY